MALGAGLGRVYLCPLCWPCYLNLQAFTVWSVLYQGSTVRPSSAHPSWTAVPAARDVCEMTGNFLVKMDFLFFVLEAHASPLAEFLPQGPWLCWWWSCRGISDCRVVYGVLVPCNLRF